MENLCSSKNLDFLPATKKDIIDLSKPFLVILSIFSHGHEFI